MRLGCLTTSRRRWGRHRTSRGPLDVGWRLRVGGAYKAKGKGQTIQDPEVNYGPVSLEAAPVLSLFAIDGWACSRVRFSLRKDRHVRKCRGAGRQKPQHRKGLPHRENSSPPAAPAGGPRATPRQGSKSLEGRRWPTRVSSRLAGAGTGAPAAGLSLLGGRGATASQWPRRLGPMWQNLLSVWAHRHLPLS